MKPDQLSMFEASAPAAAGPEGLAYRPELISAEEEAALVDRLRTLPFAPFEFQGFLGKRRTVSFGMQYRFDGSGLAEAEAMPEWLLPLRAKAAAFAGLAPDDLVHALLIEYEVGAGLGWHRDRPVFGDVVGVSLLSEAPLRFRRKQGTKWERHVLRAAPRSAYLLRGAARTEWEHSLAPVGALRYSATFRTLRQPVLEHTQL
ncbi:MAG TPA: alpha-ketoglutarate-dependent dioxygenase AlkB [Allosphingosinicella sp.]|nr:alpha-ketoglutarate-dependent dioxygenase AlkB [Allosphingosinicella sp.]